MSQIQNQSVQNMSDDKKSEMKEDGIGIPHIIVETTNKSELDEVYKHPKFPPIAEVSLNSKIYFRKF